MKLSELKNHLATLSGVRFRLANGTELAPHFHISEVAAVEKHFIDCGGVERHESFISLQLWHAGDTDHRVTAEKFLHILNLSQNILQNRDGELEVEFQQDTIGRYGLAFDRDFFVLTPKQTACLAEDACGIRPEELPASHPASGAASCCTPGGGCC